MPYQEFYGNWTKFSKLIDQIPTMENEQMRNLVKQYVEQNIMILNEIFNISINNLKKLQNAKTTHEIISTQAKFTHDVGSKLSLSTQRFLNSSLAHIADYNDWLKAHCDLATD